LGTPQAYPTPPRLSIRDIIAAVDVLRSIHKVFSDWEFVCFWLPKYPATRDFHIIDAHTEITACLESHTLPGGRNKALSGARVPSGMTLDCFDGQHPNPFESHPFATGQSVYHAIAQELRYLLTVSFAQMELVKQALCHRIYSKRRFHCVPSVRSYGLRCALTRVKPKSDFLPPFEIVWM
jgi:hypothetical protein